MKAAQWRRSRIGPLLRRLPRLKHLRGSWIHRVLGERFFASDMWTPHRERVAAGVALGMFFSMIPIPVQMFAAAAIAFVTRVNIPAAVVCTWISNPFTLPIFLTAQFTVGNLLLGQAGMPAPSLENGALAFLRSAPLPILVGAGSLSIAFALLSYPIALLAWDLAHAHLLAPARKPSTPLPHAARKPSSHLPPQVMKNFPKNR